MLQEHLSRRSWSLLGLPSPMMLAVPYQRTLHSLNLLTLCFQIASIFLAQHDGLGQIHHNQQLQNRQT